MLFQSYIFILLFFPLCLLGFWGLKRQKLLQLWLIGFSLWFYGAASPYYLLLLLGSIAWNYAFFRAIERGIGRVTERVSGSAMERAEYGMERDSSRKRLLLGIGIAGNLALLCFFKYFNAISAGWSQMKGLEDPILQLALPLGISFFTFQQIGFLADAYKGEVGACSLREYVLFVSFFPYVSSGPIVNAQEMLPQYRQIGRQRPDWEKFSGGLYLFALGLSKKVLLADTFGKAVDAGYGNVAGLSGTDAWLVMLFYTLQLYFDFSGYCDMGRGIAHMLGMELPVNFDSPYKASNIIEFWKRWHITLNRFLRKYVYIPLGGNRKGTARMYLNLFIVFLVSGIWHGAGWNFVLWGALHGALYLVTRAWQRRQPWQLKQPRQQCAADVHVQSGTKKSGVFSAVQHVLCVALTFLFLNFTWMLFRSANLSQAGEFVGRLIGGGFAAPAVQITEAFNLEEFWYVIKILHLDRLPGSELYLCFGFWAVALWLVFFARNAGEREKSFEPNGKTMFVTAFLMIWCVVSLSDVSSFLYYRF